MAKGALGFEGVEGVTCCGGAVGFGLMVDGEPVPALGWTVEGGVPLGVLCGVPVELGAGLVVGPPSRPEGLLLPG